MTSAISAILIAIAVTMIPLTPAEDDWKPDEKDVTALAQTLWGECRGCSELQQKAVCWTVFNRVDSPQFPDTIFEVCSQPNQFFGYDESFPIWDSLYDLAYECVLDWHCGRERVLDGEFLYFTGDGRVNTFTTEWNGGESWCLE